MMTKQTILRADPGPLPSQAILMFELGLASSVKSSAGAPPAQLSIAGRKVLIFLARSVRVSECKQVSPSPVFISCLPTLTEL